jgi:tetratricopeptide (TPR) repeat protein
VHASLGLAYFQQGKFTLAVPALRQAIKLKPSLPNASTLLAMSLSEMGQFDEALPGLERAFKQPSDKVLRRAAGLQLQRAYTGLERHADAAAVALQLTHFYPDDPEILYHASRVHANFAFVTLRSLAKVAPDSLWVHLAAGEANESQGLDDAALKEYRAVVAIDPKRPGIHFRIGRVLLARAERAANIPGAESDAMKEFAQELANDPTNANSAYEIAEIHRKGGDLREARTFFETALAHYPDFEDALVGLGRTLVALQQPRLAIPRLNRAIALNPRSEVAYYQLAQAHRALGDTAGQEKALAAFERLRIAADQASATTTLARPEVTKQKLDPVAAGKSVR